MIIEVKLKQLLRWRTEMSKLSNKGFTLIELVIIMAILGIILGVVVSVFAFGLNFFSDEDSAIVRQEDLRRVAVIFEKDVRKSASQIVTTSGQCANIDTTIYCLDGNSVKKDGIVISKNIDNFSVYVDPAGSFIDISLSSTVDNRNQDVDLSTRIYLRKGD